MFGKKQQTQNDGQNRNSGREYKDLAIEYFPTADGSRAYVAKIYQQTKPVQGEETIAVGWAKQDDDGNWTPGKLTVASGDSIEAFRAALAWAIEQIDG